MDAAAPSLRGERMRGEEMKEREGSKQRNKGVKCPVFIPSTLGPSPRKHILQEIGDAT